MSYIVQEDLVVENVSSKVSEVIINYVYNHLTQSVNILQALGKFSKSRRGAKKFVRQSVRSLWRMSRMQRKPGRWSPQMAHEASELLFSLANCTASERWVTLDRLFWPRQLFVTKCAADAFSAGVPGGPPPQSCGWPPGKLTCRNIPVNITILRWLCMPRY
jgi:hypothetical protein